MLTIQSRLHRIMPRIVFQDHVGASEFAFAIILLVNSPGCARYFVHPTVDFVRHMVRNVVSVCDRALVPAGIFLLRFVFGWINSLMHNLQATVRHMVLI